MSTTTTQTVTQATGNNVPSAADATTTQAWQGLASGDREGKLKMQGIPTFSDPYAQRQWMKEHMAAAFRFFAKNGYAEGISGHISMRGASNHVRSSSHDYFNLTYPLFSRSYQGGPPLVQPLRETLRRYEGVRLGSCRHRGIRRRRREPGRHQHGWAYDPLGGPQGSPRRLGCCSRA